MNDGMSTKSAAPRIQPISSSPNAEPRPGWCGASNTSTTSSATPSRPAMRIEVVTCETKAGVDALWHGYGGGDLSNMWIDASRDREPRQGQTGSLAVQFAAWSAMMDDDAQPSCRPPSACLRGHGATRPHARHARGRRGSVHGSRSRPAPRRAARPPSWKPWAWRPTARRSAPPRPQAWPSPTASCSSSSPAERGTGRGIISTTPAGRPDRLGLVRLGRRRFRAQARRARHPDRPPASDAAAASGPAAGSVG